MSLKPPWKQKNPVMEKACQAYHKQTAPAEIVDFIKKVKASSRGSKLEKEYVESSENSATVLLKTEEGKLVGCMRAIAMDSKFVVVIYNIGYPPLRASYKGKNLIDVGKRFHDRGAVKWIKK